MWHFLENGSNNIFTPTSTPLNREEDHPKQDFNKGIENDFV